MDDDDNFDFEHDPLDEPTDDTPVDPNSLSAILSSALERVARLGGSDRVSLADLVGEDLYSRLLSNPRTASAIDDYLNASPKLRSAAGRRLALSIARDSGHGEHLNRIERELRDTFHDRYAVPPMKAIKAQQRSGQRVADPLLEAARHSDISQYRRLRLRGQQRQHRHGT